MDPIAMLRNRTTAITAGVIEMADGLDGVDLAWPVIPGTSPIGLTLWHVPRTQDWLVHTCVRGVPEVVDRFVDGLPDPEAYGFGTGITPEEAREAAAAVRLPALGAYASAVRDSVDAWLVSIDEADLDAVPPFRVRQEARAAYVKPAALLDVAHLDGLTTGMLLLRPGLTHVIRHLGELDVLVGVARAAK